ncbi:hypothetical protein PI125_g1334 [Phytophthora idaei]|nr:hypothetical protein PI125_g1334 [Phytophthora idaei]
MKLRDLSGARVEGSSSSKALLRHLVHVSGKGSLSHCATAPGGRGLHSDRLATVSRLASSVKDVVPFS